MKRVKPQTKQFKVYPNLPPIVTVAEVRTHSETVDSVDISISPFAIKKK